MPKPVVSFQAIADDPLVPFAFSTLPAYKGLCDQLADENGQPTGKYVRDLLIEYLREEGYLKD